MSNSKFKTLLGITLVALLALAAIVALLIGNSILAAALMGGAAAAGITVILVLGRNCQVLDNSLLNMSKSHDTILLSASHDRDRCSATIQAFMDSLPHVAALLTPDGTVENANSHAAWFNLERGKNIAGSPHPWLKKLLARALASRQRAGITADPSNGDPAAPVAPIQHFDEGREFFFVPQATPLLDPATGAVLKVLIILLDVSNSQKADEAKSSLLSSFSHELKTPMTSIQMSIYLLLDDAADRLTPRQLELLTAARDDSDRLHRVLEKALAEARAQW